MDDGNKRDAYIAKLEDDLGKAAAAGEFTNSAGGQLVLEWLNAQITTFTNQILSNKFVNDHEGYLDARAKVSMATNIVSKLTKLSSPDLEMALRGQIQQAQDEVE